MLKQLKNFLMSFVFPKNENFKEENQVCSLDVALTPELLKDFQNTVKIWEFAKRVEKNGKYRCSFRENDGSLKKPVRIKPDYRGSFVLYVSKNGRQIASYEIEFFPGDEIAICNERIYGNEKKGYSRSMSETEALGVISMDLEQLLS